VSGWLVDYAHVFIQPSVVIVSYHSFIVSATGTRDDFRFINSNALTSVLCTQTDQNATPYILTPGQETELVYTAASWRGIWGSTVQGEQHFTENYI